MPQIHKKTPQRKANVDPENRYQNYKDSLRDDFNNSCGYCDGNDKYAGGKSVYHIDHFAPKKKFPALETSYNNLIYSCPYCNRAKSDKWPSNHSVQNVISNEGFIDPCSDEYNEHLMRAPSGDIIWETELGKYIHKNLKLGLTRHRIVWLLKEAEHILNELNDEIDLVENSDHPDYIELLQQHRLIANKFRNYLTELTT